MHIHYNMNPLLVINEAESQGALDLFKRSGIRTIWLWGYFFGRWWASMEDMIKAKEILLRNGFEVGVAQVPVGHPGNSLNPDDDTLDLTIPSSWRYRIDRNGEPVYFCADLDETMLSDNVRAIEMLRDAGFEQVFYDDDLRQGNWGPNIEGCFCDDCLKGYNEAYNRRLTREELARSLPRPEEPGDPEVAQEWVAYLSGKISRLMKQSDLPGIRIGIQVMHLGDERHGIDMPGIRDDIPGCMFRVGEGHFNDQDFGNPQARAYDLFSILHHLNIVPREQAFSETTVFPPRSLSPSSLVFKVKMAVSAGIPNIFFMSGTWMIEEDYWQVWIESKEAIERVASEYEPYARIFPVHQAYGTDGAGAEPTEMPQTAFLSGLPVKPVRGLEAEKNAEKAEVLLFFGKYRLTDAWIRSLGNYRTIIFDQTAAAYNEDSLSGLADFPIVRWEHTFGTKPTEEEGRQLRELLAATNPQFPYMTEGRNIGVIWLRDADGVILLNMHGARTEGTLRFDGRSHRVELPADTCLLIRRETNGSYSRTEW
ncbi:hypothetical protein [Paenibacillus contaminans]|uniref:Beta-galactosidase trimerisation domain-containing protein n=1 Tax=Paenibacillus contaminans TaxID=450362 RepID=A0A329MNC6_9BACL|nr:hypothetical protein [Paenibacillus contaminans]RAV21399.1 hypothetical protein DQG23_08905 [Paenibacillus contaminans]